MGEKEWKEAVSVEVGGRTRFRHRGEINALHPPDSAVTREDWSDRGKTWTTGMKLAVHMGWCKHDTRVSERLIVMNREET